ncbi:nucleotide-diphospho-sugar transferase [Aureobasidium pullulans]|nr:nucleotide-diphospho-sugar transferase [Aureobasidium pullulans]THY11112.1 nucleotide-diphospho-sugar transferase [Aureobasidium pullulans]THY64666.1 nucleotide-diphospho-sugar transferase [Aureobasidium pullulans]
MTTQAFGQGSSFAVDDMVALDLGSDAGVAHGIDEETSVEAPSPYAYVFYATQNTYACSVLVNIRQLKDVFETKYRIHVLITNEVSLSYVEALEDSGATVSLQAAPALANGTEGAGYYQDCLLKLYGFRMHQIDTSLKRVIVMDSDQLVLRNLDYLFEDKIEADLAAPRAYWIAKETFSTAFMVITLSDRVWHVVEKALDNIQIDKYDMDIANELFGDTVLMLPGHFVTLNSHWEDWNLPKWFHKPEAIVAGITNGTHEVAWSETQDLNKREQAQQGSQFEPSNYETAPDGQLKDSTQANGNKKGTSESLPKMTTDVNLPTLPKIKDDDSQMADDLLPDTIPGIVNPSKHSDGKPHLPGGIAPPSHGKSSSEVMSTETLDLKDKRYYNELYELYKQVSVLHFTAMGKPWGVNEQMLKDGRPDAHPVFREQFMTWRKVARDICPTDIVVEL